MCKCPIEIRFDDNEFIGMKEFDYYCSSPNSADESATFSTNKDEIHIYPCIIVMEVTYCLKCGLTNESLANIIDKKKEV